MPNSSSAPDPADGLSFFTSEIQRQLQEAGRLFGAEVEKALLHGLAAAFRSLADRLPQLLAEARRSPPSAIDQTADSAQAPCLLSFPAPEPVIPAADPAEARTQYQQGLTAARAGSLEQAVAHLSEAIRLDPSWAAPHVARAGFLYRLGRTEASLQDADRALQLDPDLRAAHYLRAAACTRRGDNEQAIADLTRFLELSPDHALAYHARGLACANNGDYDSAIRDYGRALRLRPQFLLARYHRALAYRLRGDYPFAVAELTQVLQARPDFVPAYLNRALARLALEEYDAAIQDCDRAVQLAPDDAEARCRREEAVQAATRAAREAASAKATPCAGTPSPRPRQPAAAVDAGKPADPTCLPLSCPRCGAAARISWKRLHQLFRCRQCGRIFRVGREGSFTEVHPSAGKPNHRPLRRRILATAAALLVAVGLAWWLSGQWRRQPALTELPGDLPSRGQLWAQGWVNNDRLLLRRLTAPTHDRQLHPWLLRHPPPTEEKSITPEVDLRLLKSSPRQAVVIVRIRSEKLKGPREFHLDWVEQGDCWYFVPSLKR
jgi:tetratricopeptide (TPR) repeat protein